MNIDLTANVLDYEGNKLSRELVEDDGVTVKREPHTVRTLLYDVLNSFRQDEAPLSLELKRDSFALSVKLYAGGDELELSTDEISFVKSRLDKVALPIVWGRLSAILEEGHTKERANGSSEEN